MAAAATIEQKAEERRARIRPSAPSTPAASA
jgi:hypothetical protein